ncbi:MAG: hypothetical protein EOP86_09645 [Verrucomicrobiaceae bacterium]|nr:MAG: hypothetical protein EOP86_09645 [Verrucomicrobiaceae bacterium]
MKTNPPDAEAAASTFPDPDDALDSSLEAYPAGKYGEYGDSGDAEMSDPEVPPGAENLVTWDEVPVDSQASGEDRMNDETQVSLHLVQEGIDEADRELRLNAADQSETEGGDEDLSDDEEAAEDYPRHGILS